MDLIWVPVYLTIIIYITAMLIMKLKGYKIHWSEETEDKITMLVVGMIFFYGGANLFANPNDLQGTTSSVGHLYTFGRQLGIIMMAMVALVSFAKLYNIPYEKNKKLDCFFIKFFYMLFMLSALISGAYGFLTRTSWGLLGITYISDFFSWLLELFFCIVGFIGIWAYFKYIRNWN